MVPSPLAAGEGIALRAGDRDGTELHGIPGRREAFARSDQPGRARDRVLAQFIDDHCVATLPAVLYEESRASGVGFEQRLTFAGLLDGPAAVRHRIGALHDHGDRVPGAVGYLVLHPGWPAMIGVMKGPCE